MLTLDDLITGLMADVMKAPHGNFCHPGRRGLRGGAGPHTPHSRLRFRVAQHRVGIGGSFAPTYPATVRAPDIPLVPVEKDHAETAAARVARRWARILPRLETRIGDGLRSLEAAVLAAWRSVYLEERPKLQRALRGEAAGADALRELADELLAAYVENLAERRIVPVLREAASRTSLAEAAPLVLARVPAMFDAAFQPLWQRIVSFSSLREAEKAAEPRPRVSPGAELIPEGVSRRQRYRIQTAGDDRVCFLAGTPITIEGRAIAWAASRTDAVSLLFLADRVLAGTPDHPIWKCGHGWMRLSELQPGDCVQSIEQQPIEVIGRVDLVLVDMQHGPSDLAQSLVPSEILRRVMPIAAVYFEGQLEIAEGKVQGEATDPILLLVAHGQTIERLADLPLRPGFQVGESVAGDAAKLAARVLGLLAEVSPTAPAGNDLGWPAACLGAVAIRSVRGDPEHGPAALAGTADDAASLAVAALFVPGETRLTYSECPQTLWARERSSLPHPLERASTAAAARRDGGMLAAGVGEPADLAAHWAGDAALLPLHLLELERAWPATRRNGSRTLRAARLQPEHVAAYRAWDIASPCIAATPGWRPALVEWFSDGPGFVVHSVEVAPHPEYHALGIRVHNCPVCEYISELRGSFKLADALAAFDSFLDAVEEDVLSDVVESVPFPRIDDIDGLTARELSSLGVLLPPFHPNCLPGDALVAAGSVTATSERRYKGELLVVRTAGGEMLPCTPNHPVLTQRGWVGACFLVEGDDLLRCGIPERVVGADDDDEHVPSRIEEMAHAPFVPGRMVSREVPVSAPDFHGDGGGSEVAVVLTDRLLRNGHQAMCREHRMQSSLVMAHPTQSLDGLGFPSEFLLAGNPATHGLMGRLRKGRTLFGRRVRHSEEHAVGAPTWRNPSLDQMPADDAPGDAMLLRERLLRQPGIVADQLRGIEVQSFHGKVYNCETKAGWYVANGLVTHNCRCGIVFI